MYYYSNVAGIHLEKLLKYGILQPIDEQKETNI